MDGFYNYLTQSSRDLDWGVALTAAGYTEIPPQTTYPPMEHPAGYQFSIQHQRVISEYQVFYITEGNGVFESEHQEQLKIGPGTIFLLFPGEWHRYYPNEATGWTEYYLGFKGSYVDDLVSKNFFNVKQSVFEFGNDGSVINIFKEVFMLIKAEKSAYQQYAGGLVINLLGKMIFNAHNRNVEPTTEQLIEKSKQLLLAQVSSEVNWNLFCKELGISYSKFRKIFKGYVGMPPGQYLLQLKVSKARELLLQSNMPLKKIAESLGFRDQYYFNSLFKQKTGLSPGLYRKTYSLS
jgi:AraC-like DNA-binding protein